MSGSCGVEGGQRLRAIGGHDCLPAVALEPEADETRELRLVIDDQDTPPAGRAAFEFTRSHSAPWPAVARPVD